MNINTIIAPVRRELSQFEDHFRAALKSNVGIVDAVVRYVARSKGKRVRPALVLLSAGACGGIGESTYRGATLVELLHTATLIHDDVVDEAGTRRGLASINAVWKNKVAVLMGDYILSRGLLVSLDGRDFEFLRITSDAVRRMSEGELLQIQKTRRMNNDEQTYFRIISDKTASLLSSCCEIGARSACDDEVRIASMRAFGENLGIAFQIRDDLLDFLGKESLIGKPVGGDLKEKKFTLPLLHAMSKAPTKQRRAVLRMLKQGITRRGIQDVIAFVTDFGGIEYAESQALRYRDAALHNLAGLVPSAYRSALEQFTQFVVARSK